MVAAAGLLFLLALAPPALAASFDAQRAAMAGTVATQPEPAIVALLQSGLAEGKAVPAIAEARKWLAQNRPETTLLFYHAARAAELSGDWKGAVSLYQQYLADADLTSDTADKAVYAVYTLLIERLDDTAGAYAFGRNQGNRLMVLPRARQFDPWFLDEAVRRNDVDAVAGRLLAGIEAGLPDDLLVARYDHYFRWLIARFESALKQAPRLDEDLSNTCQALVGAIAFNEELRLRLDWAVSVLHYNQAKLAGETVDPPLAEAKALLATYPQYAQHVQEGWLGGSRSLRPGSVDDLSVFWPHAVDAKMTVVIESISTMTALQKAAFFVSWQPDYYNDTHGNRFEPTIDDVKAVRNYLDANPDVVNSRTGPFLPVKPWHKLTVEEAQALAPHVKNNTHPDASVIRAIAVGGKDLDAVIKALTGPELWRMTRAGQLTGRYSYIDPLWNYCGRPGGTQKRDAMMAVGAKAFEQAEAGDPDAKAPAAKRVAAFKALWSDYRSDAPKEPNGYNRARQILLFTPELVPELLPDDNADTQRLLRSVLAEGMRNADGLLERDERSKGLNPNQYAPWIQSLADRKTRGDLAELKKKHPELYEPHPLERELSKAIVAGLKQGKLPDWQVLVWINLQHPGRDAKQVKLMQAILASPVWQRLSFEVRFAAREWFGKAAMTDKQAAWVDAGNPARASKALRELPETADVATTVAALDAAISGVRNAPVRFHVQGLERLAKFPDEVLYDPAVLARILDVIDTLRDSPDNDDLGKRLLAYYHENRDPVALHRAAAYLWTCAASFNRGRLFPPLRDLAESLIEAQPAVASALARTGIQVFRLSRDIYGFQPASGIPALKAIDVKASMKLGLMQIPVAKTDPAYPVYESQMAWLSGNEDTAWRLIQAHWEQLLPIHRELSVDYLMWVLQRTIYSRDETRQEELIKALQAWAGEDGSTLSRERKVEIELAYGDIAVQKGMLRQAHEIFKRTAANKAYDGVLLKYEAVLRKARVERMAKDFDAALNTLNELALERVPEIWSPVHYALAEVYYAMEEYDDANDQVSAILNREPDHADAMIMQGRLQLKRKKLMEATEVELGTVSSQQTLVPGEKLKVTLTDPTLAISGAGTEIEVVVWATSGDRERFFLRQFGDQKTKFRGEVPTALGAPASDDGVLQVIGDDEIYYAYSERFRTKMNNMEEKRGGPITVASDALLMASGRRLLSAAEQRVADMEAQMEALKASAAAISQRQAAAADAQLLEGESDPTALTETPVQTRLKPGNPIHVRVIDHDRSRTPQIDEAAVSVSASSGDAIGRVVLKETGTHTGWFEGMIPTAGAQAMAFAPNSEPGRNPNMVISPKTDYPPWQPVAKAGVIPEFRIDLNDNVPLGEMTIRANEAGAKLKSFVVQTAMNDNLWTTVARFPKHEKAVIKQPWQPSVFTVLAPGREQHYGTQSIFDGYKGYVSHLETGWMQEASRHQYGNVFATNVVGPSKALTNSIPSAIEWKRSSRWDHPGVVSRFQAYFHEPAPVTRHFRLQLGKRPPVKDKDHQKSVPEFLLVVDGRVLNRKGKALEGEINLKPGVHRLEIWTSGWLDAIGFGRTVELQANLDERDALVAVPDRFFDPARFPAGVLPHRNLPATIAAGDDGTAFTVDFTPDSQARLLTFLFLGQQGPVPVLNRISLQQPDGEKVLPVPQDFAELNKNDTLEILTGDKVAVRYVDDRYVTKAKETHERFLDVMFSNARLAFEFFEMRKDRGGNDQPYYERQLRFAHGQPVMLTISDPDMDVSPALDTVTVTVEASGGGKQSFTATEDKDVPGTFRVWIKPVTGATAAPDEIQVGEGATLTATYRDTENTNPGVPTDRHASIRHAQFERPVLSMSHADVAPIDVETVTPRPQPLIPGFERLDRRETGEDAPLGLAGREYKPVTAASGSVLPRWHIENTMRDAGSPPQNGFAAVHGQMMYFEVEAPHLALRMGSATDVFVQTASGRAAAREAAAQAAPFDITVPGTIQLKAQLVIPGGHDTLWRETPRIPIYTGGGWPRQPEARREQAQSAFYGNVPLIAGVLPEHGVMDISAAERRELGISAPHGLVVRPDDVVHVGFRFTDKDGNEQWLTGKARVITHPVLDVLEADHRTRKRAAFVGENLYLRVVDLGADLTDGSDTVKVLMQAKSGAKLAVDLLEVDTHSGIFKAAVPLTYAGKAALPADYDALRAGFPVVYGDMMGCLYVDAAGQKPRPLPITINKGADGDITPFSKQYDDPEIAMQTQFALAEAYLEMAKSHRARGAEDEAAREYDQARRLLAAVVDQFRAAETRAHAEYLLGNLTQEEADATEAADLQQDRYRAALARFMNVTGTYPDTAHASKAQFKIATIYEKLGEPDIAAQEYVKLAYKYPQSEFLALAMARLGTHFLRKASGYEKQAAPLLAKTDDKDAQFEGAAMQKMAVKEYLNAGSIFKRLLRRFPSHELAGQGGLRAGQAYMRAAATRQAVQIFLSVVDNESYDGPDVRAQAMYWAGMCYQTLREPMAAYAIYKRLTYDFPESKWAAYARGQLSQERMLNLETNLEIERLQEEGQ